MKYEFDGKKYDKASTHQKEWGIKLIEELDLQGMECVLDLGCGDGSLTARIAELLPRGEVLGIDASQGMIKAAKQKEQHNLSFHREDINNLSFAGRFDVVFSNATLHWIMDHRRLLANVHRALRAGGRLRFNFAGDGNCASFFKVVREAMAQEVFTGYFASFKWPWYMPSVDGYRTLAESSELNNVQVWGENADRNFPDVDTMIQWIDQPSLVPFLIHIDDLNKESFRSFVIRRMIEETKQEDGRCFETFRRINLSAVK
ncbi:MAG: methyltransferase domain-containing protein [Acidobacteriota bacterium]|jgi:trans-aconitate 2-methyltransferase